MISSATLFNQNTTFSRKQIKPILKKPSRHVYPPEDLNLLIKKGIKVKNLKLTKKEGETKSLKISLIKKLIRSCKYLYRIQIDRPYTEDINHLLKIQCKIRYIQSLQLISINSEDHGFGKRIKKLLIRFKYLKKYTGERKVPGNEQFVFTDIQSYLRNGIDQPEKTIPLASLIKGSFPHNDYKKAQRLILNMRKRLSSLAYVEESQSSFTFAVNIDFNFRTREFDKRMLGFIRRFKRKCPLDHITLPVTLLDRAPKVLPFAEANQLNVISQLEFTYIISEMGGAFERFLSRKDARIILDPPLYYSWQDVLTLLKFSQDIFLTDGSVIDFKDFTFDFHAPLDVRQMLLTRFKQKGLQWERVIFLFKAGWLQENERSCLEDLINELCKEENKNKYSEIHFEMAFKSAFEKGLVVTNMNNDIFSVIKELIQRQQKVNILMKYTLKINFEGANTENLLSFLGLFQQIPNTISVLKLDLFSENIKNIIQKINNWKPSRHTGYMILLKDKHQSVKQLFLKAEKIKKEMRKLKENNSFMEIFIPQLNEIDELHRLVFKVGKKICDEFSVNVDLYLN